MDRALYQSKHPPNMTSHPFLDTILITVIGLSALGQPLKSTLGFSTGTVFKE